MVAHQRIGPDGAFVREISEIRERIKSMETAPAGTIVIREQLVAEDPVTGVKTIVGQLPDGSVGFRPFVGDIVPPPVASTPVVTAQPGILSVAWDGLFVNNEEKPSDFQHVNVIGHEMDGINTVRSLVVGVIRLSTESVLVTQEVASIGEAWQFSFESEDYNGNKAVRSARSASVVMLSAATDEGVNAALEEINGQVISAQNAAVSAQNAADTAQGAADDAAQAVVELGAIKGAIYTQSTTPSADANGLWIDTGHNNVPRRYLGKTGNALVANVGGGASIATRLSALGYSVSAITVMPTFEQASSYDLVAFDAGYAGLGASYDTLATKLLDRGVSVYTSGNDTTSLPYLFTGSSTRGATKTVIRPSGTHPAAQGWASYSDNDANFYLTGINSAATVTGVTLVGAVDQPMNVVREHPTTFARWAHLETYASPAAVIDAHINWVADNWVAIQDQGIISASSAAASAQVRADQAFNSAVAAADAAGTAQDSADGKNTNWNQPTQPAGTGHKVGDTWFDSDDNYTLRTWDGSAWITAQDSWRAQQTADSKALIYTQSTVPPVEARVPSTIWNDTSLGIDKIVVKYWNGSQWTATADKTATDAAALAATKTKTYFQPAQPSLTGNTNGDLWFDTDDLNRPYVWDGAKWALAQDATVNKSIFGTFSTDIDSTAPNKWMFTRYDKTGLVNNVAPSYLDIVGLAGTSSLVADGTNLVVNVGEQYIGQLRTIVNVVSSKTITVTATHDDGAQIYVDGVSVYTKTTYTQNANISFNLSAGWHVIDMLWLEQAGGDGWSAISPTFGSQVTSMFAPVSLSSVTQAVSAAQTSATAAQTSADTAMKAQSYSLNASFDDWTGTFPTGYSTWSGTPVKETTLIRRAPNAIRFNVADTTTQAGVAYASIMSHAPNLEYFTVELEFYLVSGGLGQAGMILDWGGLSPNRAQINLFDEVPSPSTGKWYRVVKTLRRPTSATGTFTSMNGYLMGQWSGHTGGGAAKNIIFDWFNVRPSSAEEILAYNAPADAQTKATAAQNAAISAAATDATNKANTAQTNAINAAQAKIDQVWATSRSYVNPTTNTTGLVAKQGPIPSIVTSASAMGGYALQKSGSINGWIEDWNAKQAYDPTALYRFTIRVRIVTPATTGGTGFYWGLVGLAADGTAYVNATGANSYSSQQWVTQNAKPATTGEWVDYTVYYSGISTGNPSGAGTSALAPRSVHANTRFFVPGMILDYNNGNGVWEVSHWSVDVIDASGYQAIVDAQNAKTDAIATAAADATSKANAAQAAAISAAATDAANKAAAAQQAAIDAAALDATAKAEQAEADALAAAAITAQQKADAAQQAAIDAAATHAQLVADGAESDAIAAAAITAQQKADAAEQAAITAAAADATAKANQAEADAIAAAATDAQTRATQAKADAIAAAATDATTKADAAQMAAIQAQAYQLNPSFEDWTGTIPANYTTFVTNPTKETTTVRTGKNAVRFNCTDATTQRGLQFNAALAHAPYFEYLTVELDVRLVTGSSFGGAGVLVDWNGMTGGNRFTLSLATEIPAPVVGRWYRVTKVIRKPATATGTFTNYSAWLMGQYSAGMGTQAVKDIIFDWINVRPSTTEEITAYGTPASIQSLTDTVNTKTKSWFQTNQPPLTGNTAGDLWFDTDDNNKTYIWVAGSTNAWTVASDQRIESLNTAVSAAQTSANGKNKIIWSTSDASGTTGYVAGDTWFKKDASGTILAQWEFTTSWQPRTLNEQIIPNLSAGKIVTGTLGADRIATNSLHASKLMVSDPEELIPNPFFHPSGEPVVVGTIVTTATSPVSAGAPYANAIKLSTRDTIPFATANIAVRPGDEFYMEAKVRAVTSTTRSFSFYIFGSNTPTGGLSAKFNWAVAASAAKAGWIDHKWSFKIPDNATYTYIKPVLQVETVGGDTVDLWEWYVTGWSMRRKNKGELIVDGAIKAGSAIIETGAIGNAHIGDLAVGTAEIQDLAVKTAKIDDLAVTNAKIQALSAEKINAGFLDVANRIDANAIKASKLNITLGGENLVANSSFEADTNNDGLADGWNTWARGAGDAGRVFTNTRPAGLFPGSTYAQRVTSTTVTNTEQSSIQATQLFSIAPGASATISLYGRASVAGNFSISIRCEDDTAAYKGDASFIAAFTTATQRFVGTVVIPAGTTRGKVTITTPGSLTNGHWFEVDGIKAELGDIVSAWGPMTSELLPGTIVGTMLKADAIDGMIITGPTIQTTATANRGIKLSPTEFAGYDASGVKNFSLTTGGTLAIKGDITAGSTITGATITGGTLQTEVTASRGIKITTTEFAGYDTTGAKNFSLTSAGVLSLKGSIESGSTIKGATLAAGTGGIETTTAVNRGVKIKDTGIITYDASGNMTFKVDAATGLVEAPGIKANSIKGDIIEAGSLQADKLLISSSSNAIVDPAFQITEITAGRMSRSTGTWAEVAGTATVPKHLSHTTTTTNDLFLPAPFVASSATKALGIPVVAGQKWLLEVESETSVSAGVRWNAHRWHADGTFTYVALSPFNTATGKRKVSYVYEIPAGVVAFYPSLACNVSGAVWKVYGNLYLGQQAGTTLIADGAITTDHITVGTLDGAVISANTLKGTQFIGKSITTDKLVVSSTDNLIVEADFGNGGTSWGTLNANKTINATAGRGSLPALRVTGTTALQTIDNLVNRVTVGSEDRFRGSMYIKSSVAAASGVAKLRVKAYTSATAFTSVTVATSQVLVAGAWTLVEGYSPALPANTIAIEFFLEVQNAATGTILDIDYVGMTRAADGRLVVDGAIDGKIITGAQIQTAASGARIVLDTFGLRGWNADGLEYLTAGSSGLSVTGVLRAVGTGYDYDGVWVNGQPPTRPIEMAIGAAAGNVGFDSGVDPADGAPIPGFSIKPVGVDMYAFAQVVSRDGQELELTAGMSQAEYDEWYASVPQPAAKPYTARMTLTKDYADFSKEIRAPKYLVNGKDLSAGEVIVFDSSGSIPNAAVPVPRLGTMSINWDKSSNGVMAYPSNDNPGCVFVYNEAMYDITFSYGQNAPVTADRNFIEIKIEGNDRLLGRASFNPGEDSVNCTVTGVKLPANAKIIFEVYQNSGAARTYTSRVTIKRVAAPVPVTSWGNGDITHTGNVTVSGAMMSKPQRAEFVSTNFSIAGGNTPWDSGPVTADTAKTQNNDFCKPGPFAGSVEFTRNGYYQISHLLVAQSSPGASWTRLFLGSTGENLCQVANSQGQIWEQYLSTVPTYIAAGDYVRSTVIAATQHNATSRWKIARMPWA